MKTSELLTASEAELVPQLREMKSKELERHATKLLKRSGGDYANVLAAVTKAVPTLGAAQENAFDKIQAVIRACCVSIEDDACRRISVIMMMILKKQFLRIHNS